MSPDRPDALPASRGSRHSLAIPTVPAARATRVGRVVHPTKFCVESPRTGSRHSNSSRIATATPGLLDHERDAPSMAVHAGQGLRRRDPPGMRASNRSGIRRLRASEPPAFNRGGRGRASHRACSASDPRVTGSSNWSGAGTAHGASVSHRPGEPDPRGGGLRGRRQAAASPILHCFPERRSPKPSPGPSALRRRPRRSRRGRACRVRHSNRPCAGHHSRLLIRQGLSRVRTAVRRIVEISDGLPGGVILSALGPLPPPTGQAH